MRASALYAPIEVDGRLLGDGALSSNTPLDLVLDGTEGEDSVCFAVDLFAREGRRPHDLAGALSRAGDLAFGNQTRRILEGKVREFRERAKTYQRAERLSPEALADTSVARIMADMGPRRATVLYLSFRAGLDETGPMKGFDFSRRSIVERWEAGGADMADAVTTLTAAREAFDGLRVIDVRSGQ